MGTTKLAKVLLLFITLTLAANVIQGHSHVMLSYFGSSFLSVPITKLNSTMAKFFLYFLLSYICILIISSFFLFLNFTYNCTLLLNFYSCFCLNRSSFLNRITFFILQRVLHASVQLFLIIFVKNYMKS